MTVAIIDSDTITYSCAGACQHQDKELGVMEYEPVENALHLCKRKIESIKEATECDSYEMYLTASKDSTCFRTAMYPEYKANRARSKRPRYYHEVREYMIQYHKATVVATIEADDIVAMRQHELYNNVFPDKIEENIDLSEFPAILCGIDKDLDQVPGLHYNYNKGDFYYITPLAGFKNLWKQIMAGDDADNIKRIKPRWLSKKLFTKIDKAETEEEVKELVIEEVKILYPEIDAISLIESRGHILYLKRHKEDGFKV